MPIVEIPGVGPVEFPDSMSAEEINAAATRLYRDAATHEPTQAPASLRGAEGRFGPPIDTVPSHRPMSGPAAFAEGFAQTGTLGFTDELQGLYGALAPRARDAQADTDLGVPVTQELPAGLSFGDRYRQARDLARVQESRARQDQPGANFAGTMTGAAVTGGRLMPAGARLPVQLGAAAGQGGLLGAGYSDADLVGGDVRGVAADTALGAGLGLAGHALGRAASAAARRVRAAADQKLQLLRERAAAQATKEGAEELASEVGRLGGFSQDINRQVEWIIRLLDEEASGTLTPANRAALEAFRQTPAYAQVVNRAAERVMAQAPASAARAAAQEAKVAAIREGMPQGIAERTQGLMQSQVRKDARSLLKSYGEPAAAAYLGYKAADLAGADPETKAGAAAAAGLIFGRTRAGKAIRLRLQRPGNQAVLWRAIQSAASAPNSPAAEALVRALAPGTAAMLISHKVREEE